MSCSRYHALLSQNLDGRLSSARREELLDHLAVCADCARLAEEMRAAQEVALRMPSERVSDGFRETLYERIAAGEGTPPAVFDDPVPVGKRVLYAASGAAAAALMLVAINLLSSPDPRPAPAAPSVARVPSVGSIDAESGARALAGGDTFASGDSASSGFGQVELLGQAEELRPANVAQRAQLAALQGVNDLRIRTPRLRATLQTHPTRARDEIEDQLRELRVAVRTLRWMSDEEFIALPTEFQTELSVAERGIGRLESASNANELAVALEFLSGIRAENLERRFSIVCCDTLPVFLDRLCEQVVQNPDVPRVLRVELSNGATLEVSRPGPTNPLERARLMPTRR